MTTLERREVRRRLINTGFRRCGTGSKKCEYDHKGKDGRYVGNYTEYWQHPDGTKITLKWAPKTRFGDERDNDRPEYPNPVGKQVPPRESSLRRRDPKGRLLI